MTMARGRADELLYTANHSPGNSALIDPESGRSKQLCPELFFYLHAPSVVAERCDIVGS